MTTNASRIAWRRRMRRRGGGRHGKSGGGGRRLLIAAGALMALLVVAGGATAGGAAIYGIGRYNEIAADVVPAEELIATFSRGGAQIYDRNGELIYEFVDELSGLRRPVPLSGIAQTMIDATTSTEDPSYWTNNGLNTRGLARAALENLTPYRGALLEGSGGSSITQQLAKNIYIPREERADRSINRKIKEMVIALELTESYSKEQILEWYLNSISYSGIYTGVEAAANGYFDKPASALTLAEAALLAGIPQSPALYDPLNPSNLASDRTIALGSAAKLRQRTVLQLMVANEIITAAEAAIAAAQPLRIRAARVDIEAAHFVLIRVANEIRERFGDDALNNAGLQVWTTIDLTLQRESERILEKWIAKNEEQTNTRNGALLMLDPKTGEILVYIGSRDFNREDIEGWNDNITASNSPGSTLKPFTYMRAFMEGWGTGTGIMDTPITYIEPATGVAFSPRNPSGDYQGIVTAAEGLGNSLNIPAFKTILFAGVENTVDLLKQVGFTTLDDRGYGPSLTLGGVEVTLEDATIGYSVLANQGIMRGQEALVPHDPDERKLDPVSILKVTDHDGNVLYEFTGPQERRVVPSNFAYLPTNILSNNENRCITFSGCGASLNILRPAAAKTGTSEPFENSRKIGETWTFGYTPDLVVGIWAGNADNAPITNIYSTTIAGNAWREVMIFAHDYLKIPVSRFKQPPGLVELEVCWPSGRLPSALCPQANRYTSLFAEDVLPRNDAERAEAEDTWWQLVRIDIRTGLLANETTPAAFVSEEVRLVLPPEEIEQWDGYTDWVLDNDLLRFVAPTEQSADVGEFLALVAPVESSLVSGLVTIRGRAFSEQFQRVTVEWGRGLRPESWVRISSSLVPVPAGDIATWNTLLLPDGAYTLRVVVEDAARGRLVTAVSVTVINGEEAAEFDTAPRVSLITPLDGSVLREIVQITGTALSGQLTFTHIDVGAGFEPLTWTPIAQLTRPVANGLLALWETRTLEDGVYTLRVTVNDRVFGRSEQRVIVVLKNDVQ